MAIINFRPKTTSISNNISSREEYERVKMQRACIPPSLNLPSFYINCFFFGLVFLRRQFFRECLQRHKAYFLSGGYKKNTSEFTTTDIQIFSTRRLQPTNSSLIIILIIWECHHVISQLRLSSVLQQEQEAKEDTRSSTSSFYPLRWNRTHL